jgi:hypothetical protein
MITTTINSFIIYKKPVSEISSVGNVGVSSGMGVYGIPFGVAAE